MFLSTGNRFDMNKLNNEDKINIYQKSDLLNN